MSDAPHFDYQRVAWLRSRSKDLQPVVCIQRGLILEFGTQYLMEDPTWEEIPMETIIVRPRVRWFGRETKGAAESAILGEADLRGRASVVR